MFNINADHIMSLLFMLGFAQMMWISVMVAKRGVSPKLIWQSSMPLFAIWVLAWPVYTQAIWLWFPIGVFITLALLSYTRKRPFWQYLHAIWGGFLNQKHSLPWSILSFTASLAISIAFFQSIPEFGFGLALAACLAFPLATLFDRIRHMQLGFLLHPEQTLLGHLSLIISSAFLCAWSVHLYHGVPWQQLLIATLIAGIAASLCRALLPRNWNQPAAILAMGWILWLL
jgi:ABC-type xylose transport system permease subunit